MLQAVLTLIACSTAFSCSGGESGPDNSADQWKMTYAIYQAIEADPAKCEEEYAKLWASFSSDPMHWRAGIMYFAGHGPPLGCEKEHCTMLCRLADLDSTHEDGLFSVYVVTLDGAKLPLHDWLVLRGGDSDSWLSRWLELQSTLRIHEAPKVFKESDD